MTASELEITLEHVPSVEKDDPVTIEATLKFSYLVDAGSTGVLECKTVKTLIR